jgi:hypothetical protein
MRGIVRRCIGRATPLNFINAAHTRVAMKWRSCQRPCPPLPLSWSPDPVHLHHPQGAHHVCASKVRDSPPLLPGGRQPEEENSYSSIREPGVSLEA